MEVKDNVDPSQMPTFERAIDSADKRLKLINRQKNLTGRIQRIFHTFNKAFEDIQKALPEDTELESHSDRVCFEIKDVPISIIYIPQSQPTFIAVNKQNLLSERIYICDSYFGKNSYEMVGPSEREVGSIFVCEDTYLVRWSITGRSFFYSTVYDMVDSAITTFFGLGEMYKDKYGNVMEVNFEEYHHNTVTTIDLLTQNIGEPENPTQTGSYGSGFQRTPVKKSINLYGKNIKM